LSLVGILIVAMVGIRSLARVEIEHTGRVIHMAIKLPGHRRRVAAVLFVYDLLVLAGAGFAAVVIETNRFVRVHDTYTMAQFGMVFLILGSLALWGVRVHRRLWVRATMRDIASLQLALLAAAAATFTIFSLVYATLEWSALRLTLISNVFASVGVCIPRMALDLFRELGLEARHHKAKQTDGNKTQPVVIFGAGSSGTLLLDHLKSCAHDVYPDLRILGFLDDMRVLHGRRIRSFQILGDLSAVPKLVKDEGLEGIVLAIRDPRNESLAELDRLADRYNLKIYRWKAELEER
jgi:FlaA1/EpsC-like NDP-sugar epimerase